jgi:transcription-repair coupling factor (superfamily II helicase)
VVVLTRASLDDAVGASDALKQLAIVLKRGKRMDREALIAKLAGAGYEHVPQVAMRGQFAVRGGILDIYSFHHTLPMRVEWFDDEIESLRHFDLDAQTSVQQVETCTLLLGEAEEKTCPLREYLRAEDLTIDAGADWDTARVRILEGALRDDEEESSMPSIEDHSTPFFDHGPRRV